ncbi:RNA pseudouridine synthase 3 mitochondrial, partial [Bienertia sinuspersici]
MGRTKESTSYLQQVFTYMNVAKTSCLAWNDACETTSMKHWAFGHWVLLDDGKTERVMLTHPSGVEASQEAMTEYWVLGPIINGCEFTVLKLLAHTLWVTTNMDGLCIKSGTKRLYFGFTLVGIRISM